MMESESWYPREKPPLGERRDFEKEDKETAEKILSIEFVSLEECPEIMGVFQDIGKGLNDFRQKFNAPEMRFEISDVRFINKEHWKGLIEIACVEEDNGAFWDPLTGKCYIRFDREEYDKSRMERISKIYEVCHELGHKALPPLEAHFTLFKHLSEGLADFAARETMEGHVLPKIYTFDEYGERENYIKDLSPKVSGFKLQGKELFVAIEGEKVNTAGYSRIPEMRLVEKMMSLRPDEFKKMLELFLGGDFAGSEEILRQAYGEEAAGRLAEEDAAAADINEIMEILDKKIF